MLEKLRQSLIKLDGQDKITLSQALNSGDYIICADAVEDVPRKKFLLLKYGGHVTYGIKYAYKVVGNLLYIYILKDSTEDKIVLSLAAVAPMTQEAFSAFYDIYISKQDVLFKGNRDLLDNAKRMACIPEGQPSVDWSDFFDSTIRSEMTKNTKQIFFLETPPTKKSHSSATTV